MPTEIDLPATGLLAALLLGSVAVGEGLRRLGVGPNGSRRAVHAVGGVAIAALIPVFDGPGGLYLIGVAFAVANAVARPRGWVPSMHSVERETWGTVLFPLALLAALPLTWSPWADRPWALMAAFAVMALADPAASLAGERWGRGGPAAAKTRSGSLTFVVVAGLACGVALAVAGPERPAAWVVLASLTAAALATVAEALGRRGWDNLWVVLAVVVALTAADGADPLRLALALAAMLGFALATDRLRALDASGALAGSLLAWGLVAFGGWAWAVPALAFFVLSSALSRLGRERKAAAEALAEKGSRRDAGQVLANGGVALAALAASLFWPSPWTFAAFVGAFSAAAADTWGTEVGTWVGGPTRRLGLGRTVPPGTSGGVSLGGTLGALAGAASVAVPAALLTGAGVGWAALAVAAGAAGAALDTVLGATLQARYRAPDGALTERPEADGAALPLEAGRRWLGNDGVNLACTLAGAALAAATLA